MTSSTPGGDSYVYVIGSAGSSRVKIGTSVSPEKRLKLQTGNPDRLEVLWYTPGGRELEALLHQVFAGHRVEGEWFDFGDVQPVGAIPAAVHQHAGITPRAGRPTARTAPRRSGARAERGEQITPERLAGIVRDVVLGVVRPEPEPVKYDDQEGVPVRRRRVDDDLNRLMAFLFGPIAARHAWRTAAGKTGLAALGGWLSLNQDKAVTKKGANPNCLEVHASFLQDGDDAGEFARYIQDLRRNHLHTDKATALPMLLHMGKLMADYLG